MDTLGLRPVREEGSTRRFAGSPRPMRTRLNVITKDSCKLSTAAYCLSNRRAKPRRGIRTHMGSTAGTGCCGRSGGVHRSSDEPYGHP